ncbi:MAG: hypothetical protein GY754_06950 [bacterium]|nr:hypothetical protein [bacterium]
MGEQKNKENIKVGKFLVENGIITDAQLNDALDLQKHNPERLLGQVLVTQGVLSKEDLIMALEMYLMVTNSLPEHVSEHIDEWLDQEEVDMLQSRLVEKNGNNKSS